MHDIKYIRNNPDEFQLKLNRRGVDFDVNEGTDLHSSNGDSDAFFMKLRSR